MSGDTLIHCQLTKDKVVRPEQLSKWAGANRIHGSRLQINQDGTGNKFAPFGQKEQKIAGKREVMQGRVE